MRTRAQVLDRAEEGARPAPGPYRPGFRLGGEFPRYDTARPAPRTAWEVARRMGEDVARPYTPNALLNNRRGYVDETRDAPGQMRRGEVPDVVRSVAGMGLEATGLPSVRRSARGFASGDPATGAREAGFAALGLFPLAGALRGPRVARSAVPQTVQRAPAAMPPRSLNDEIHDLHGEVVSSAGEGRGSAFDDWIGLRGEDAAVGQTRREMLPSLVSEQRRLDAIDNQFGFAPSSMDELVRTSRLGTTAFSDMADSRLGSYRVGGSSEGLPLLGTPDIAADPLANIRPAGTGARPSPRGLSMPNEDRRWPMFGRQAAPQITPRAPPPRAAAQGETPGAGSDSAMTPSWVDLFHGSNATPGTWRGALWTTPSQRAADDYARNFRSGGTPNVRRLQGNTQGAVTMRDERDLYAALGPALTQKLVDPIEGLPHLRRIGSAQFWELLDEPQVRDALRSRGVNAIRLPEDFGPSAHGGRGAHESYLFLDESRIRDSMPRP